MSGLMAEAQRDHALFDDLVLLAGRDPVRAWAPVGRADVWPDDQIRRILVAAIVRSLRRPWVPLAAACLRRDLAAARVEFVVAWKGDKEPDVGDRYLLWSLACAYANADLFEGFE